MPTHSLTPPDSPPAQRRRTTTPSASPPPRGRSSAPSPQFPLPAPAPRFPFLAPPITGQNRAGFNFNFSGSSTSTSTSQSFIFGTTGRDFYTSIPSVGIAPPRPSASGPSFPTLVFRDESTGSNNPVWQHDPATPSRQTNAALMGAAVSSTRSGGPMEIDVPTSAESNTPSVPFHFHFSTARRRSASSTPDTGIPSFPRPFQPIDVDSPQPRLPTPEGSNDPPLPLRPPPSEPTNRPAPSDVPNPPIPAGPRMPWRGAIPSYFIVGPDGNLVPHFVPHPNVLPPNPDDPNRRPIEFFFPFGAASQGPAPNPEKARELLRGMKSVDGKTMKRVNRIVMAEAGEVPEKEKGWKCGVCLEGVDGSGGVEGVGGSGEVGSPRGGEQGDTGVKGLPCNHLFHEGCLEPWLETHHTCPTCRRNLDPEGSQHPPITRMSLLELPNFPPPGAPMGIQQALGGQQPPRMGHDHPFTFIWRMPLPVDQQATADTVTNPPTIPPANPTLITPPTTHLSLPRTPTVRFELPLSASPLPMEITPARSRRAVTPPDLPGGSASGRFTFRMPVIDQPSGNASASGSGSGSAADDVPRPAQPERRPHIHVGFPHRLPRPHFPDMYPMNPAPHDPGPSRHWLTHLPIADNATASTRTPLEIDDWEPQAGLPFTLSAHAPFAAPAPPSQPLESGQGRSPVPIPAQPRSAPPAPIRPLGTVSLATWVQNKERMLGWRCHAEGCCVAPTDEDGVDKVPGGEECKTIGIFTADVRVRDVVRQIKKGRGFGQAEGAEPSPYVCEHVWHLGCLAVEDGKKRLGSSKVDMEGKREVDCAACDKRGWVFEGNIEEAEKAVMVRGEVDMDMEVDLDLEDDEDTCSEYEVDIMCGI